jgi:hypothetical protein
MMTADGTDAAPAAEVTESVSTPTPAAPNANVPAQVEQTDASVEVADDLLYDDDDAGESEEGQVGDSERVEASAQYDREDYTYTAPKGTEVTEMGERMIAAFGDFAHKAGGLTPEAFEGSVNWFNDYARQEVARMAEADNAASADLVASFRHEFGPRYRSFRTQVNEGLQSLPKDLRAALKSARLPTGGLLINTRGAIDLLHQLGQQPATPQAKDKTAMQKELAQIDNLMANDIDAYRGSKWKNTGLSPSDRRAQIMQELHAPTQKPSAAALQSEEAALLALLERDEPIFTYAEWRNSGMTGAERLTRIREGRA